jgi:hypothetical protein
MIKGKMKPWQSQWIRRPNGRLEWWANFPIPTSFSVRFGAGGAARGYGALFSLQVKPPGSAAADGFLPIELSLWEAYIYCDFDIEGNFTPRLG